VGRCKTHALGEQRKKEQVTHKCATFALIETVNKGAERYIYIYILCNLIKINNIPLNYLQFY